MLILFALALLRPPSITHHRIETISIITQANKPEAERARDIGAEALRNGQLARAIKLFSKSLQLYPLPGVEALLAQAKRQQNQSENESNNTTNNNSTPQPQAAARASSTSTNGDSGRPYTPEQAKIVKTILAGKEGGRGAHYRILGIQQNASEADIKKAYRKLAVKIHPDKNSAPHADEAFKAVGLAYATLSDPQKREIYDRYGEEDPDNRGGGGASNMARHFRRGGGRGGEPTPEEIFNMFFGGGMPGGGGGMHRGPGGFHVYTNGFGFGGPQQGFRGGRPQGQQQQREQGGFGQLLQLLPLVLIMLLSFLNYDSTGIGGSSSMPGNNRYFSLVVSTVNASRIWRGFLFVLSCGLGLSILLHGFWFTRIVIPQHKQPFTNPLTTKLTGVKDIPYYVNDKFLRTYYRDRYQLSQVERMVENAYQEYLVEECTSQQKYKTQLDKEAKTHRDDARMQQRAQNFELTRCQELDELFPKRSRTFKQEQQKQKQKTYGGRYR